jgi:hypothetical protein
MRKTTRLYLILLPISVLMLAFFVSVAGASNRSFVIGSMQEAVEKVNLGVSDQVVGNLSIINGHIDFFIDNPDGITVQEFLNVSNLNFNFVADKNGTYSMRLNNTYQAFNVTAELDYGVNRTYVNEETMNVGSSSGIAQVITPPLTRPLEPDNDNGPTDNLVEPYLNFLRASEILNTASSARTILPSDNVALMCIIASVLGLIIVVSVRARRPNFFTNTARAKLNINPISGQASALSDDRVALLSRRIACMC